MGSTRVPYGFHARSRSPLEQLLDPLVGQPKQLPGIPHAQTLGARQPAGGCPRGRLRTGLLALCAGTQNTLALDLARRARAASLTNSASASRMRSRACRMDRP